MIRVYRLVALAGISGAAAAQDCSLAAEPPANVIVQVPTTSTNVFPGVNWPEAGLVDLVNASAAYSARHNEYLVAAGDGRHVLTQRLSAGGDPFGQRHAPLRAMNGGHVRFLFDTALAADDSGRYLLAVRRLLNPSDIFGCWNWRLFATGIDETGNATIPPVGNTSFEPMVNAASLLPSLVFNPDKDTFFFAGTEYRSVNSCANESNGVRATTVSFPGPAQGEVFTIAQWPTPSGTGGRTGAASRDCSRNQYLVPWTDQAGGAHRARICGPNGDPITAPITIAPSAINASPPASAYDPVEDRYLVAMTDGNGRLFARFVSGAGTLLPTEIVVTPSTGWPAGAAGSFPALAYLPAMGVYVVAWHQGDMTIRLRVLNRFGTPISPIHTLDSVAFDEPIELFRPTIASNGQGQVLVAWPDWRNRIATGEADIYACLIHVSAVTPATEK